MDVTYAEDAASITTLTVTPTDGGTVTLTGAATFAADATITLAASGSVSFASQVTTLGKLSLVRSDGAYIVWTGDALTENNKKTGNFSELPFADGSVTAADLEPTSVVYVATNSECRGRFDRYVDGPGSSIFVINRVEADHSYSIRPQISSSGLRCVTASRSKRFGYYPKSNLWSKTGTGIDKGHWCREENLTPPDGVRIGSPSELGLTKIFAALKGATMAQVRFDGGAALGGETAVAAVPEGDNVISGSFTGDGDVRIVPMAPTTAYAGTGYLEPWITKTSWQILATNRSLSALTALTGRMLGGSHNYAAYVDVGGTPTDAYHIKYDPATDTATCQFQYAAGSNNKVVMAMLRQNGPNVEIKATAAGYKPLSTHPINTDFSEIPLTGKVATSASTAGYGIHMITASFGGESKMGIVTLDNSMDDMVGNQLTFEGGEQPLYVTVISKTAFPSYGDVNVGTNADVLLHVDALTVAGGISGGTSTLKVHRGGVLRRDDYGQISKPQQVIVDGGTLEHLGANEVSGGIYLNYLLLKDGARMTTPANTAPRTAFDYTRSYYNVVGTEPSSIDGSGIRPYGYSTVESGAPVAFCLNVNDVTGDEQVDCTLSKFYAAGASFAYYNFEKWGDGTLKLEGDGKPVRLETRLYGGTFILGASNSMTNEVVLAGGSIATADDAENALGALTVSNACTIAVGEGGALSFASFTAGEELAAKAITVDAPVTGDMLKFGTSLTSAQRALFRWKDGDELYHVRQDENGYLRPILSGLAISIQ